MQRTGLNPPVLFDFGGERRRGGIAERRVWPLAHADGALDVEVVVAKLPVDRSVAVGGEPVIR